GALPFNKAAYEDTIRASGRAIDSNLAGFSMGFDAAGGVKNDIPCGQKVVPKKTTFEGINDFPQHAHAIITYGVHKLVDYQDAKYAKEYLELLRPFINADEETLKETARHLALWMCFEDVIRVADLKTRVDRTDKINAEVRAKTNQIWYGHDYFHPRYTEICDTLPVSLGRVMRKSAVWKKILSPFFAKGRILKPKTIRGYLMLRFVANLRRVRLRSLRFNEEHKRINGWLETTLKYAVDEPELALEIAKAPRIIKGYGDTHARGVNRFSRIMMMVGHGTTNDVVRELKDAALLNDKGEAFDNCLKRHFDKGRLANDRTEGEASWAGSS
ncbi:MAG: hypothetical protein P8P98_07255, partial [Emcibacteraceae bacterium]|nr:hypothetical protein [Emcibacteraceae bacterium]